jgi:hypothetical protein
MVGEILGRLAFADECGGGHFPERQRMAVASDDTDDEVPALLESRWRTRSRGTDLRRDRSRRV